MSTAIPMQAALRLAEEYGVPIFPCRPDKKPYTLHGFKDSTTNLEAIEKAWLEHPDALVGVPTGRASRIDVVDVDPDGLVWYQDNAAALAAGRIHKTRRNGFHLLYRAPEIEIRNSASQLARSVDVRGEGGYIIWWPAHGLEAVGALEDMVEPPKWLLETIQSEPGKVSGTEPAGIEREILEGGRNEYLSREAFRLKKQGMEAQQILGVIRALNDARCVPSLSEDELKAIVAGKKRIQPEPAPQPTPRRAPIAWNAFTGREPPPREWIIPHWIPARHTTLLAGRGGIGKTLLGQHIASALALGHEYLEMLEPRRVLMWAGEDDEAELWRRQQQISSYMRNPLSALTERFYLHSYAGEDITLMAPIFGALTPTAMLTELREQVADYRAEVVILDNVARLFGGNENDRHAVTTFCALVQGACAPAAVILLGHPAKAAGSEFSGSTAWEGAVRARLYLSDRPPDQPEDEDTPADDRVRYLSRRKANYSALDIRRMALIDGVLVPATLEPARRIQPTGEFLKDVVRRAVRGLASRDIYGSESDRAGNYLPRLARKYKLLETASEKTFGSAMRELIMEGELETREVGKDHARRARTGLVLVESAP